MFRVVCILKEKSGKTIGAKVTDGSKDWNVKSEELLGYKSQGLLFSNAVITSDGHVRGKDCHLPSKTYGIDIIAPLYHGSIGGIRGNISLKFGNDSMDFGRSFYLGTHKMQAVERASKVSDGYLYTFELDTSGLKFYSFKDDALWALYVAKNRRSIDVLNRYSNLLEYFRYNIDCCDVVYGYIADDKMANSYDTFIAGGLTDKGLIESLKLVKYGKQYALRTDKAIGQLSLLSRSKLSDSDKNKAIKWGRGMKYDMVHKLSTIRETYEGKGTLLFALLRKYDDMARLGKL